MYGEIRKLSHLENFSKPTKLHGSLGEVQFTVFDKFISAYLHQIELEIILLRIDNLPEKSISKTAMTGDRHD